jgi:two-component system sensor histidine kinase VicK
MESNQIQPKIIQIEKLSQQLEETEARLKMLVASTKLGTWDYNPITGDLHWSDECKKIYGALPGQSINFDVFVNQIHTDDKIWVESEISNAMNPEADGNYDISYRIRRFDNNEYRWIRAQGKVFKNHDGYPSRFIGTVLDITDAMEANKRSATLAAIITSSDDAIVSKTLESIVTSWNGAAERMFGYTAAEMIGQSIVILIPPDRQNEEPHILERLKSGERVEHFETKRITKHGELIDVSLTISPIKDDNGRIIGLSKIARDITERKNAQQLLQKREEHFRLALNAAHLGTFDMDIVKGTMEWDSRCKELFGIFKSQSVTYNKDFLQGLHPEDRERISLIIEDVLDKSKSDGNYDVEYRTVGLEDKKIRWVRAMGKAIFDVDDKPIRFIGTVLDITSQKQEELRKNDFVAIVSHELKTPLTSMYGYIQIMLQKANESNDALSLRALNSMHGQTKKMIALIKDFLDIARLEEGKLQLLKKPFRLHPLLTEVCSELTFLSAHEIELQDCEDITVIGDRDKIGQVLSNLLSNAIKYSPKGGKILIGCDKEEKQVKIFVKDEGVGIHAKDLPHLFERFYRVDNEQLQTITGFGIGLYLSSEIIKSHGSSIIVESVEGEGSTFYFYLPCH